MRNDSPSLVAPYIISITLHVLFFGWIIFNPAPKRELPFNRDQVLDVSMVTMKEATGAVPAAKEEVAAKEKETKPAPPKEKVEKPSKEDAVPIPSEPEPEVQKAAPVEPPAPKVITSLKKKTFKPKEVKKPVQKIVEKKETPKSDSVSEAIKKLEEKVKAEEMSGRHVAVTDGAGQTGSRETQTDGGAAGRRRAELIDLYRLEIAQRVNKNWVFSEQLAGEDKNLMASLVFKVMPNGEIRDIFFIDRSGNQYLDDSAYKAVVKTNPAPPHPKGLVEAFVDVGLRFTPEGIR